MRITPLHFAIAAATAALLSASPAIAATPAPKGIVQRVKDPGTGLEVRVQQERPGTVSVEIGDRAVTVRRELRADRLETTVTAAGERISLTVDKDGLLVTAPHGRVRVTPAHPEAGAAVVRLLSGSPAIRRGVELLGRVNLGVASPTGQTLLLTRAFLLSVLGERDEALAVVRSRPRDAPAAPRRRRALRPGRLLERVRQGGARLLQGVRGLHERPLLVRRHRQDRVRHDLRPACGRRVFVVGELRRLARQRLRSESVTAGIRGSRGGDMRALAVVVQILISLSSSAASLMPVLLMTVPEAQARSVGPPVAIGMAAFAFVIVRMVWPRHKG